MTPKQNPPRTPSSRTRAVGIILAALLPVVAAAVALKGRHYDPELYGFGEENSRPASEKGPSRESPPSETSTEGDPATKTPAQATGNLIPETLLPALAESPVYQTGASPFHFDPKTIYEKINGAAPEYLDLGFRELMTLAFEPKDEEHYGCELFVYDMASPENARKIYEQQRGEGATDTDVGDSGYRFAAAWFFHKGPYYVIVMNADEGEEAERFSETLARGVAERRR